MIGESAARLDLPPTIRMHPVFYFSLLEHVTDFLTNIVPPIAEQDPAGRGDDAEPVIRANLDHKKARWNISYSGMATRDPGCL